MTAISVDEIKDLSKVVSMFWLDYHPLAKDYSWEIGNYKKLNNKAPWTGETTDLDDHAG